MTEMEEGRNKEKIIAERSKGKKKYTDGKLIRSTEEQKEKDERHKVGKNIIAIQTGY